MAQSNADQLATLFRKAALAHDRALAPVGARDPHVPVELYAFLIELYVNEMPALVLGLSSDGAINRRGNGTGSSIGNKTQHGIIAQTNEPFFQQTTEFLDRTWLNWAGVHTRFQQRGPACVLRLSFFCRGLAPIVVEFHYGAQSSGPPPEIRRFFIKAVEITQPWYDEQSKKVASLGGEARRPWWKLW